MRASPLLQTVAIQALAVVTALALGALLILLTGGDPLLAYRGLWEGSIGRVSSISEALVWATPYIFAALAVALAFKAGLFNIGAEGQLSVGALTAAGVGFAVTGVPWPLHAILAIAAGMLAGAIWAGIAGALKSWTGAHEAITTIMLNYIALLGLNYYHPPASASATASTASRSPCWARATRSGSCLPPSRRAASASGWAPRSRPVG